MWLDSDNQRATTGGTRATFYLKAKQDAEATATEGRPIVRMAKYVRIEVPADKSLIVDRPIRETDKTQYAAQWLAFEADKDQDTAGGTLLSATGLLPPERVEELNLSGIRTVEQYGGVSDSHIPKLGLHSLGERQKCRDFIAASKSNAPLLRMQQQIDADTNAKEVMQRQIAELQALVEGLKGNKPAPEKSWGDEAEATPPKRRGRPPKAVTEDAHT